MASVVTEQPVNVSARLAPIIDWPHWDTIKAVAQKEYGMTDEQIEEALPEYQRFLGLIAAGYTQIGMFSETVDKLWHSHILCTSLYEPFCQRVFGRFIHHIPNLDQTEAHDCTSPAPCASRCLSICRTPPPKCTGEHHPDASVPVTTQADFIQAYLHTYGEQPPAIWNLTEADGVSA